MVSRLSVAEKEGFEVENSGIMSTNGSKFVIKMIKNQVVLVYVNPKYTAADARQVVRKMVKKKAEKRRQL